MSLDSTWFTVHMSLGNVEWNKYRNKLETVSKHFQSDRSFHSKFRIQSNTSIIIIILLEQLLFQKIAAIPLHRWDAVSELSVTTAPARHMLAAHKLVKNSS